MKPKTLSTQHWLGRPCNLNESSGFWVSLVNRAHSARNQLIRTWSWETEVRCPSDDYYFFRINSDISEKSNIATPLTAGEIILHTNKICLFLSLVICRANCHEPNLHKQGFPNEMDVNCTHKHTAIAEISKSQ